MNEVVGETQREVRVVLWTSEAHADAHVSHKMGFFEMGSSGSSLIWVTAHFVHNDTSKSRLRRMGCIHGPAAFGLPATWFFRHPGTPS